MNGGNHGGTKDFPSPNGYFGLAPPNAKEMICLHLPWSSSALHYTARWQLLKIFGGVFRLLLIEGATLNNSQEVKEDTIQTQSVGHLVI
jgi:hypothetical protein